MGSASNQMIPLGFNFPFFGQTKSSIWITSNGYLTFDSTLDPANDSSSWSPVSIPDINSESSDAIYPYWTDLFPGYLGGQIYYYTDSTNHQFIVEYKNVPAYCWDASSCQQMQTDGAVYTFEVILNQDGTILMQYNSSSDWSYLNHTIGIQNSDKTKGLQYPTLPAQGRAIVFQPTTTPPQVDPIITFYNDETFTTPITSISPGEHLYIQVNDPQINSGNTNLNVALSTSISTDTEDLTLNRVGDVFQGGGLLVSMAQKAINDGTLEVENNDQITLHYQKTSGQTTTFDFSQTDTNSDAQQISIVTSDIGMSELSGMSLYNPDTKVFSSDGNNVFLSSYYSDPWEKVYIRNPLIGSTNIQTYSIPTGVGSLWNTYQYGDTLYSLPHNNAIETLDATNGIQSHPLNINANAFPSYIPPPEFYDMAIPSSTTGFTMSSLSGSGTTLLSGSGALSLTQLSGSGTILTGTGTTLLSGSGSLIKSPLDATLSWTGSDSVVALSTQSGGNGISILDSLNTQNLINWIHPNWTPPNNGIFATFIKMDKDNNLWFAGMDRHIDGSYVIDSQYFEKVPPILDGNRKVINYDIANAVRYEIPHPVDPLDNSDPTVPFYASWGDPQAYIWEMSDAFTIDTNGNIWFDIPVGLYGYGPTHYYVFDTNTKTLRDITTSMMALIDNNLSLGKVTISGTDYPLYQFDNWFVTKDGKIYLLLGKNGNMPYGSYLYDVPSQFCQIDDPLSSTWTMTCLPLPDPSPNNPFHLSKEITSNYNSSYNSFLYDDGTTQRIFFNTRDLVGYLDLQDKTYHYLFTQKFPDGPTYSDATAIEKYNIAQNDTLYDVTDPPCLGGGGGCDSRVWNTQIYYMDVQNIDPTNQITISWKGYNTVGDAEQVSENDIYLEAYNQNTGQWDVLDSRLAYTGEPNDFELSKTFTDPLQWAPYINTTNNIITYRVREFDAIWSPGTSLHTNYTAIKSIKPISITISSNPLPLGTSSITYTLAVTKAGTGSGNVTSSPASIDCGSTCSSDFDENISVTLTASPDAGSSFTGWSGDCTGTNTTCTLTMDAAKNVTATFNIHTLVFGVSADPTSGNKDCRIDSCTYNSSVLDFGNMNIITKNHISKYKAVQIHVETDALTYTIASSVDHELQNSSMVIPFERFQYKNTNDTDWQTSSTNSQMIVPTQSGPTNGSHYYVDYDLQLTDQDHNLPAGTYSNTITYTISATY
jgi:hypothetical protein